MQFDERKRGIDPSDLLCILFCLLLWKLCKDDSSKHDDTSRISLVLSCCLRMIHPARTEMQDSRLSIRDATVGFMFF